MKLKDAIKKERLDLQKAGRLPVIRADATKNIAKILQKNSAELLCLNTRRQFKAL